MTCSSSVRAMSVHSQLASGKCTGGTARLLRYTGAANARSRQRGQVGGGAAAGDGRGAIAMRAGDAGRCGQRRRKCRGR